MKRYVPFGLCQLTLTIPQEIEPDLHFPREQNQVSTPQCMAKPMNLMFLCSFPHV